MPPPPSTREMKPQGPSAISSTAAANSLHPDTESNVDSVQMTCSLDNESQREDARSRFSADQQHFLTADDFANSSLRANAGSRADMDNPSVDYTVSDSAVCVEEEAEEEAAAEEQRRMMMREEVEEESEEGGSVAENVSLVSDKKKE